MDDSADFRKDVRVRFGKESISLAPFHLGRLMTGQDVGSLHNDTNLCDPRWGVSLWRLVRFSGRTSVAMREVAVGDDDERT